MNVDRYCYGVPYAKWHYKRLADSGCLFRNGDLALSCRKAGDGVQVVGADFTRQMLQISEQKKQRKSLYKNVRLSKPMLSICLSKMIHFKLFRSLLIAEYCGYRPRLQEIPVSGGRMQSWSFQSRVATIKAFYGFYMNRILPWIGQFFARNEEDAYLSSGECFRVLGWSAVGGSHAC